jgi:hypothetical protein
MTASFGAVYGFNVSARAFANGRQQGQIVSTEPDGISTTTFRLDCVVVDGNVAYLGGVVTASFSPSLVGQRTVTAVQDNGEGHGAVDLFAFTALTSLPCTNASIQSILDGWLTNPSFHLRVTEGNIQVRDR